MITAIYHIMVNIVNKLFRSLNTNSLKKYDNFINEVNKFEESISNLTDEELSAKTNLFKAELKNKSIDKIIPEAFAVVREAAKRTVNMRHLMFNLLEAKYCMRARSLR